MICLILQTCLMVMCEYGKEKSLTIYKSRYETLLQKQDTVIHVL